MQMTDPGINARTTRDPFCVISPTALLPTFYPGFIIRKDKKDDQLGFFPTDWVNFGYLRW